MQLADGLAGRAVGQLQIQFSLQIVQVFVGALGVPGDDLVAGAVVAQRFAERNVHIQRQRPRLGRCALAALGQRQGVVLLAKGLDKAVGGGERGIARARHVEALQQLGGDCGHGGIFPWARDPLHKSSGKCALRIRMGC
ncbi:hypothetical protein D3C71_1734660 [compost metagenome]